MGSPTAQELYGGPSANYTQQFDEYGRPIMSQARAGDADSGTFSYINPDGTSTPAGQSASLWTPGQTAGGGATGSNSRAGSQSAQGYIPAAAQGSKVGQDAAYQALSLLSPIAQQGFTSADMMGINAANNASALQSRAMIQSLAQQAQMRGAGQGGVGQMQQAQAAQQAANFGNQQGTQIGMAANDRRMNAISGLANIGFGADAMATGHQQPLDEQNRYATEARGSAAMGAYQGRRTQKQDETAEMDRLMGMFTPPINAISGAAGGR